MKKSSTWLPGRLRGSLRFLAVILFAATPLVAQSSAAGITSVVPDRVVAGLAQAIEIHGEGLSGAKVSLAPLSSGMPEIRVKPIEPASPQRLRILLPGDVRPGVYRICVALPGFRECRSLEVLSFEDSVQVSPKRLFRSRQETLVISVPEPGSWKKIVLEKLESGGASPKAADAQRELAFRRVTQEKRPVLAADVPLGLAAGRYRLLLSRYPWEDPGLVAAEIEVSDPLAARIERVVPPRIRRYREGVTTITVEGDGLEEVTSASLLGVEGCLNPTGTVCRLLARTDRQLQFRISPYVEGSFGDASVLVLADGTRVPLPELRFLEPVVPWGKASWAVFVILLLAAWVSVSIIWMDLDSQKENQTAPGMGEMAGFLSLGIVLLILIVVLVALSWGAFTDGFRAINLIFLGTTILLGLDIWLPFGFAMIRSNLDPKHRGSRWPYITATAAALLALGGVFVLDALDLLFWVWPGEAGLLGLILVLGGAATARARRRLDRQRTLAASEKEVAAGVELGLYRNGRVFLKDFPAAPRQQVVQAMVAYWTGHRANHSLMYSQLESTLAYDRWQEIQAIAQAFETARTLPSAGEGWQEAALKLTSHLSRGLPFTIKNHPGFPRPRGPFAVFRATPALLESVLPSPFPLLISSVPRIEEKQFQQLQGILNELDAPSRFALLISLHPGRVVREEIAKRLGGLGRENLVVLDERDCIEILMGKDEIRGELMKAIQQQADISVFSPYHSEGPTTAEMFFGREREIRSVLNALESNSASVLGARRVGKTSMVRTIQRLLEERGKLLFYLDCYHIATYQELFQEISNRWRLPGLDLSSWSSPLDFPRLVHEIESRNPKRSLVFLLDEIDRLLAYDSTGERDEKFFRLLRSLSQERRCQFIFSGERTILDRRENSGSAFFNFGMSIQLGLLDGATSSRLVSEPMALVGVVLEDKEALLSLIYERTSGHPHLIQFLCGEAMQELSRVRTRALNSTLVRRMAEGSAYRDRYVQTFWSQATPLEKAISICLAEKGAGNGGEIWERLQSAGFPASLADVERGFRYLRLSQLLATQGDRYLLKPKLFASFVQSMYPYAFWMKSLLQEEGVERRTDERAFG